MNPSSAPTGPKPSYSDLSGSFDTLLDMASVKYARNRDYLSLALKEWIFTSIEELDKVDDLSDFSRLAQRKIDILETEILVDSLYKRPLHVPMLDNIRTYENAFLQRYFKRTIRSPFDGRDMSVKVHEFARDMLAWIALSKKSELQEGKESKETALVKTRKVKEAADGPFSDAEMFTILHIAKTRLTLEDAKKLGDLSELLKKAESKLKAELLSRIGAEEKRAKDREKDRKEQFEEALKNIDANHSATANSIRVQLAEENTRVKEAREEISIQTKTIESLEAQVAGLRRRIGENEQRMQELANQKNRRRRFF